MDQDTKERLIISLQVHGVKLRYRIFSVLRLVSLSILILGILGVFGPFFDGVPRTITIQQAPAWLNDISVTFADWGPITIPVAAFVTWQLSKL